MSHSLQSEAAFSAQDEANMAEIYALLSLPGAALPDVNAPAANERYQPEAYLQSVLRWPEDKRFPRKPSGLDNGNVLTRQSLIWHDVLQLSPPLLVPSRV